MAIKHFQQIIQLVSHSAEFKFESKFRSPCQTALSISGSNESLFFIMWNENLDSEGIGKKLLPTKVAPKLFCPFRAATSRFSFSCEIEISMELARSRCRPKPRLWPVLGKTVTRTCPRKRASAQIRIKQYSDSKWRRAKACKRCQAWFWINCNQNLQPNRSHCAANETWCLKEM